MTIELAVKSAAKAASRMCLRAWDVASREVMSTLDWRAFQAADSLSSKLSAVSWPRAGVYLGLPLIAAIALIVVSVLAWTDRPPMPSDREFAFRVALANNLPAEAPPNLIAANRSKDRRGS